MRIKRTLQEATQYTGVKFVKITTPELFKGLIEPIAPGYDFEDAKNLWWEVDTESWGDVDEMSVIRRLRAPMKSYKYARADGSGFAAVVDGELYSDEYPSAGEPYEM